jgi:hypothetical protein
MMQSLMYLSFSVHPKNQGTQLQIDIANLKSVKKLNTKLAQLSFSPSRQKKKFKASCIKELTLRTSDYFYSGPWGHLRLEM